MLYSLNGVTYDSMGEIQMSNLDVTNVTVDDLNNTIYMSGSKVGINKAVPDYEMDIVGSINMTGNLNKNGVNLLTDTTLASGVVNSSLTSVGTLSALTVSAEILSSGMDITNGNDYQINNVSVLSNTTLGSSVVNSSLTSVGSLAQNLIVEGSGINTDMLIGNMGWSNDCGIKHNDLTGQFQYALKQSNVGHTMLNSAAGHPIDFLINDFVQMILIPNGNFGINVTNPAEKLEVDGNILISNSGTLKMGGTDVLTSTTLGVGVLSSSLTNVGTLTGLNLTGDVDTTTKYQIGNVDVLTGTTLGTGVVNSSLTSVGSLAQNLIVGGDGTNTDMLIGNMGWNNDCGIKHNDLTGQFEYALKQSNVGHTMLNSAAGQPIDFLIDDFVQMILIPNGNFGINVTNPSERLEVDGNIKLSGSLKIGGTDVLTSTSLGSSVVNSSLTSVGTLTDLLVEHSSDKQAEFYKSSAGGWSYMSIGNLITGVGGGYGLQLGYDGSNDVMIKNKYNSDMRFYTNDTERITINNDGKVGVNKVSPSFAFDMEVVTNGAMRIRCPTLGNAALLLENSTYKSDIRIKSTGELQFYSPVNNGTGFTFLNSSATNLLTIEDDGSVGIGITNPTKILEVKSTTSGFLPPRMTTTQRDAITGLVAGETIYNTTTNVLNFYNGTVWGAV